MTQSEKNILVKLSFEKTSLPPFSDILILGKECPLGMNGVGKCLDFLVPDGFDRYEVADDNVAAIIVNRNILKRLKPKKIIDVLSSKVFPFAGATEIIKVDFTVTIVYESFSIEG